MWSVGQYEKSATQQKLSIHTITLGLFSIDRLMFYSILKYRKQLLLGFLMKSDAGSVLVY